VAAHLRLVQALVREYPTPGRERIYRLVAGSMGGGFERSFRESAVGASAEKFSVLITGYLVGKSPVEVHQQRLVSAFENALKREEDGE